MKMASRLAWYALAAVLAIIAFGMQMDRQAATRFGLAYSVPVPFRSDALMPIAIQEQEAGQAGQALQEAARLVRKSPVSAENLSIYAMAASASGNQDLAGRAIGLAAGRGWRAKAAQLAMISFGLSANKPDVVAARLSALWAIGGIDAQVAGATRAALARADVRRMFARQNVQTPERINALVSWGGGNLDPVILADLLDDVRRAGGTLDCAAMGDAVGDLLTAGKGDLARRFWTNGSCGPVADYAFAPSDSGSRNPFAWTFPSGAGLDRDFLPSGAVQYRNTDPITARLATRRLVLAAGAHTIAAGVTGVPPTVSVTCQGGNTLLPRTELHSGQPLAFTVPQGCGVQVIAITASTGEGGLSRFEVR